MKLWQGPTLLGRHIWVSCCGVGRGFGASGGWASEHGRRLGDEAEETEETCDGGCGLCPDREPIPTARDTSKSTDRKDIEMKEKPSLCWVESRERICWTAYCASASAYSTHEVGDYS